MTEKNYPLLGQKIIFAEHFSNGSKKEYISQILELNKKDVITVAVPIHKAHLVTILDETHLTAIYNIDDKGIYEFECIVLKKEKKPLPQMIIKKISPITKTQRRNFFRLNHTIPVKLKKYNSDILDSALSKDISGGGIRIITSIDIRTDDIIYIEFILNEKEYRLSGKVVRTFDKMDNKHEIAVEYTDIVEIDRNDIIRYLFQQQRILIKRGI